MLASDLMGTNFKEAGVQVEVKVLMGFRGFLGGSVVKNLPANVGDMDSIPGPRRSHMPWTTRPAGHSYRRLVSRAHALKQEKPLP